MRSLARLKRKVVLFTIREVEEEAKTFTHEHGEGLHVRVEELAVDSSLVDPLASHQLIGLVTFNLPKVEIVPQMRKIVTAMILAPRKLSIPK